MLSSGAAPPAVHQVRHAGDGEKRGGGAQKHCGSEGGRERAAKSKVSARAHEHAHADVNEEFIVSRHVL